MEDSARQEVPGDVLEFRLPDLGEGLADAELVSWSVGVGDRVELNQTIADVETAKAVVSLPSPFAGEVIELLAEPGDTVPVGAALIRVRTDRPLSDTAPASTEHGTERSSVLVGYGPEAEYVSRRRRPVAAAAEPIAPEADTRPSPALGTSRAAATPAARKLARELGVDLWYVAGSGPNGAVTVEDVRGAVPVAQPRATATRADVPAPAPGPQPIADQYAGAIPRSAREQRTPITGVRKRTAAAMVVSARTIPQASTFVTVDVTAPMELLDHLRTTTSFHGLTLTPLALVAKAVLAAIAEFPAINAFWDEANHQIVTKHYVNLGIAVATDRGLLVPNLGDAQTLSLRDLCREITRLAETARSGNATPADLRGGTFTITNVGVFGVDVGVPLVNSGEAAILCLGSIHKRPWVFRDELAIRWVTTLGLSFDHRMIDGELGACFLATIASLLEDPLTLLSRV